MVTVLLGYLLDISLRELGGEHLDAVTKFSSNTASA